MVSEDGMGLTKDHGFALILTVIGYVVLFIVSVGVAKLSTDATVYDKCSNSSEKQSGNKRVSTKKTYIYSFIFVLVEIAALIALFKV